MVHDCTASSPAATESAPPGIVEREERLASRGSAFAGVVGVTFEELGRAGKRTLDRVFRTGLHRSPLRWDRDRAVLVFLEDIERDQFVRGDRHLRRTLRRGARALRHRQRVSGFGVAVELLLRALRRQGCSVVVNDRELARRNPAYPVALMGYRHVLDGWDLPNPALLGPGLFDHPQERPDLMSDARFRAYVVASPWTRDLFEQVWPGKCFTWFAGIDLSEWPHLRQEQKDFDLLVYEKFLWDTERNRREVLAPIEAELKRRGLRVARIRYGAYDHDQYRDLLRRSRGMLYLCEHETQGIASAEAMASNVPILAWDQGQWLDPIRFRFGQDNVPASSTPYFDARCGEKFRTVSEFPGALDRFLSGTYRPRDFVEENLSIDASGRLYVDRYRSLIGS